MKYSQIDLIKCAEGISPRACDICVWTCDLPGFTVLPASLHKHHAWVGGLLDHTMEVILLSQYACSLRTEMDTEAIFLGALLHDIGKIRTYADAGVGWRKVEGYTAQLHMHRGLELLLPLQATLEPRLYALLQHIIRSHHGRLDWGAIEEPNHPIAWMVHSADVMSALGMPGSRD